jgi:hypothetical protein
MTEQCTLVVSHRHCATCQRCLRHWQGHVNDDGRFVCNDHSDKTD